MILFVKPGHKGDKAQKASRGGSCPGPSGAPEMAAAASGGPAPAPPPPTTGREYTHLSQQPGALPRGRGSALQATTPSLSVSPPGLSSCPQGTGTKVLPLLTTPQPHWAVSAPQARGSAQRRMDGGTAGLREQHGKQGPSSPRQSRRHRPARTRRDGAVPSEDLHSPAQGLCSSLRRAKVPRGA